MPRGRPKKKPVEKLDEIVEKPEENNIPDAFDVPLEKPPEGNLRDDKCYHCGGDSDEMRCFKGDRNQFKFCSTACYNADKTLEK